MLSLPNACRPASWRRAVTGGERAMDPRCAAEMALTRADAARMLCSCLPAGPNMRRKAARASSLQA